MTKYLDANTLLLLEKLKKLKVPFSFGINVEEKWYTTATTNKGADRFTGNTPNDVLAELIEYILEDESA